MPRHDQMRELKTYPQLCQAFRRLRNRMRRHRSGDWLQDARLKAAELTGATADHPKGVRPATLEACVNYADACRDRFRRDRCHQAARFDPTDADEVELFDAADYRAGGGPAAMEAEAREELRKAGLRVPTYD